MKMKWAFTKAHVGIRHDSQRHGAEFATYTFATGILNFAAQVPRKFGDFRCRDFRRIVYDRSSTWKRQIIWTRSSVVWEQWRQANSGRSPQHRRCRLCRRRDSHGEISRKGRLIWVLREM